MGTALLVRNDAALTISFTPEAQTLKNTALEMAGLIARVGNAAENDTAVGAQSALKGVVSLVEKARKEVKEPVLVYGRTIDEAARKFTADLVEELSRISGLIGNFATLEQAKVRAAEAARNEELSLLERQRATAASQVNSHEALDAVNEHFDRKAAELPVVTATRSEGQIVKSDWLIDVTDIWLLARTQPTCVKIEPRLSEIKELLKLGVDVKGVKATPIVNSTVRVNSKAIQV